VTDGTCPPFASDCHVRAAVELISHTWDPVVLAALRRGPTRRHDLLTRIAGIRDKVLTESLRRLTERRLVTRQDGGGAAATYELTALGESFASGPLAQLARWAAEHQDELAG
jgi:DNA-binding HxlR family transcriptional regulator